jgi:hypothetical protein
MVAHAALLSVDLEPFLWKMKLAFITVLAIASFTSNPAPGWTQPGSQVIADLPPPPAPGTPDGQQTPAGTRGETCKQTDKQIDKPFTALVPENGKGLTTAEHPIFWFYIPDAPDDIHSIEFSVHDQDEKTTLYRTSLQLTKTPGVIGIPLPPSPQYSLKLNEIYHWRFTVTCVGKETSGDPIILELDGWVTRVQQSPDQVIWYDELTNLAKRYLLEPQNIEVKKAWAKLLESVGLKGLAQEPVVSSNSNSENN